MAKAALPANDIEPYCNMNVLDEYDRRRKARTPIPATINDPKKLSQLQFMTVRHPYERLVRLISDLSDLTFEFPNTVDTRCINISPYILIMCCCVC